MDETATTHDHLREVLKTARHNARLTQELLAELSGTSVRPIYVFETSKGSIKLDTYLKLLHSLGLELQVVPRKPRQP